MDKILSNEKIQELRATGVLHADEIAISSGDLVIAENVVTKKRRILEKVNLHENKRRVLKG